MKYTVLRYYGFEAKSLQEFLNSIDGEIISVLNVTNAFSPHFAIVVKGDATRSVAS